MNKIHDIVELNRMAAEDVESLTKVENAAGVDLDNGRLVAIQADGTVKYAITTDKKVYLHASVEKIAEQWRGLTEFSVSAGQKVRMFSMMPEDTFKTTAFTGPLVVGDTVGVGGTSGLLTKIATPAGTENFLAVVESVETLGYYSYPAVVVRVIKA